jgi:hypothetical protein
MRTAIIPVTTAHQKLGVQSAWNRILSVGESVSIRLHPWFLTASFRSVFKMSWPHLQLGCEIVRGRGVHAASTPPDNIPLKRAEAD